MSAKTLTPVDKMNDWGSTINGKLKTALNRFFKLYPDTAEGCVIRKDWDGYKYMLIIEESSLYYHLQGEYGWDIHTAFYNAFDNTGWHFEMVNSCQIAFYKD